MHANRRDILEHQLHLSTDYFGYALLRSLVWNMSHLRTGHALEKLAA